MPEDQNGILIFSPDEELPQLPEGLEENILVISIFGFKIIDTDSGPAWLAASEDDFRASESQRLKIDAEDVQISLNDCRSTGPRQCSIGYDCRLDRCKLFYNPNRGYYYCKCA